MNRSIWIRSGITENSIQMISAQCLPALKSNMAARFWHVRLPRNKSAFLHDLEAYHELESTPISFTEVHSYPKLLEVQTNAYETHFFVNGFAVSCIKGCFDTFFEVILQPNIMIYLN